MNVGIVGSREFPQIKLVEWFIRDLPGGVTVISGNARGVDQAAEHYARARGLAVEVFAPDLAGCRERWEFTERYHARNQRIVDACDLLVAFTEKDSGGTWDTIKRARRAGKAVKVIRPSVLFPGESAEEPAEEVNEDDESPGRPAGAGPFQLRRASFGSYALRRKSYIDSVEWADIITLKDTNPAALADRIAPAMIRFFERYKRLGALHAVTVPPKSVRHLDRVHVMDLVAGRVAEALNCEFACLFEPWEKATRGRHAKHGDLVVRPEVARFVGKVVWVLDDIYTTGRTLCASVQGLIALEVHAHGLAWVYMA